MDYKIVICLFVITMCIFELVSSERYQRAASKCQRFTGFNGRLKYKRSGNRAVFKCRKGGILYGDKRLDCQRDGTWSSKMPVCIKTGCTAVDLSHSVYLDMSERYGGALLTFSCEADYQLLGATEVYCDGRNWNKEMPTCAATLDLIECDFEKDMCGWTQDDTDQQDWIRNAGATSTGNTGPMFDHTILDKGTGHYLFFEASNPTETNDQARLISPEYKAEMSPMCFDFWYHMLGPDEQGHVGSIELYIRGRSEFLDDLQPVFYKEGNQGNVWHRGEIPIDGRTEPYQIVIVATRKLGYVSDIAIDDLRLFNCTDESTTTSTTDLSSASPSITSMAFSNTSLTKYTTKLSANTTIVPNTNATMLPTTITSKTATRNTTTVSTVPPTVNITGKPSTTRDHKSPTPVSPTNNTKITSRMTPKLSTSSPKPVTTKTLTSTTISKDTTNQIAMTTSSTPQKTKKSTTIVPTILSTKQPTTPSSTTPIPTTVPTTPPTRRTTHLPPTTPPTTPQTEPSTTQPTTPPPTSASTRTTTRKPKPTTKQKTKRPTRKTTIQSSTVKPTQKSTKMPASSSLGVKTTTEALTKYTGMKSTFKQKTPKQRIVTKMNTVNETNSNSSSNTTPHASVAVQKTSEHPADETLKPLMIGLGVGIVVGLIIIGVIGYVCVRRRKFYTSRYEDELKPITTAESTHSVNNVQYYHDQEEEYDN